jgi:dolichyl-phosphate beta-glucosyltransferase
MRTELYVPVFNGQNLLEDCIHGIREFYGGDVIIVDDGSTDDTLNICHKLSLSDEHLKFCSFEYGETRRENLFCTMNSSKADLIGFLDADLSVHPRYIERSFNFLRSFDVVIGNRYHESKIIKRKPHRMILSQIYNGLMRKMFSTNIMDHNAGWKFFKTPVFKRLYQKIGYDKTLKRGWWADVQLIIEAMKLGYEIHELPVQWDKGKESSFDLIRELQMIPYIINYWRKN